MRRKVIDLDKLITEGKTITVYMPTGRESYKIGKTCNMPKGKIGVFEAQQNFIYWNQRGWNVVVE